MLCFLVRELKQTAVKLNGRILCNGKDAMSYVLRVRTTDGTQNMTDMKIK